MDLRTASGTRLETRAIPARAGEARTLVFLHEGLGSVSLWRDFPDRVAGATGLGALVYSRRGYGGSDPAPLPRTPRFMHEEAWDVLPEVLRAAGVARPVLVGHSDGASIALLHAARFAAERVVALAPHLFVEDETVAGIAAARVAFDSGALRAGLVRHHRDVDHTFGGWCDVWLSPAFRAWNIEAEAARVSCPVLAIQGRDDEYGTPAQLEALRRAARGPVETLLLDGCGHSPQRDRPDEVTAAIAAFVG